MPVSPSVLQTIPMRAAGICWHQPLCNYRFEAARQLGTHQMFLLCGKTSTSRSTACGCAAGVQRSQHQMTGFRSSQRQTNRVAIAQFPQQNHIRIFTQCGFTPASKRTRNARRFPLLDQRLLAVMDKLNRIFQREDMPRLLAVQASTIAASVVDLPLPVAPVTRISPSSCCNSVGTMSGRCRLATSDSRGNQPHASEKP